jgi:hypothetical protein
VTRLHYFTALAVFVLALVVYGVTVAPSVGFVDSGLLTVAVWSGGNAHPPGFPLYLMLTKLATLVPIGSVARRVNFASAFFGAAACAATALATGEALRFTREPQKASRGKGKKPAAASPLALAAAMLLAGSSLLFGRTLWRYATIAEVYALNTLLLATIFWLVFRWRRTGSNTDLLLAAAVFGMALGVHHVTIGVTLPGLTAFVLSAAGVRFFRSRSFIGAAGVAITAFLAVYSYLPIAASRQPVLNWGDPSTLGRWWQHITGAQFRSFVSASAPASQIEIISDLVGREFSPGFPFALLLAIVGLFALLRRDRPMFLLLTLSIAGCVSWMLVYPIKNDRDAYLLPIFVTLAISAGYGLSALARGRKIVIAALLILPVVGAVGHWPYRDRSKWELPRIYSENALRGIESRSLLITGQEQLFSPLFYFQEIEGLRDDVRVFNWHLMFRSWYVEHLERRHPHLFHSVRDEVEAYRPFLWQLRDDANAYTKMSHEMNARFDDLILGIVREETARGVTVHMTEELAFSRNPVDQNFVRRLHAEYRVVPAGMTVAILRKNDPRTVKMTPISLEGLVPSTTRYDDDDAVLTEVLPAYRSMLLLRARFRALEGDLAGAVAEYRQALQLDPTNQAVANELRMTERRMDR